jgi:hypothetical protein
MRSYGCITITGQRICVIGLSLFRCCIHLTTMGAPWRLAADRRNRSTLLGRKLPRNTDTLRAQPSMLILFYCLTRHSGRLVLNSCLNSCCRRWSSSLLVVAAFRRHWPHCVPSRSRKPSTVFPVHRWLPLGLKSLSSNYLYDPSRSCAQFSCSKSGHCRCHLLLQPDVATGHIVYQSPPRGRELSFHRTRVFLWVSKS